MAPRSGAPRRIEPALGPVRTEREVMADALAKLLVEHTVRAVDRLRATAALGLTFDDIEAARRRQRAYGFRAPSERLP